MTDATARLLPLPDAPPTPTQLKASLATLGEWCLTTGYMEGSAIHVMLANQYRSITY
jgi:hypothetical protein